MKLIKSLIIQTIIILLAIEFFSFALTSFNLLIFNEKPIYFKNIYKAEAWLYSDDKIGPWHRNLIKTRHVKSCFDVNYASNNIGARDNKDYYVDTFKGSLVLIGDSFAEGYGIKLDDTFGKLLEKKLNKNVINLGSSSSNPKHNYLRFKKFAKNKDFDEIVYLFFPLNDFISKKNLLKKNKLKDNIILISSEKFRDFFYNFTYTANTIRTIKFLLVNKDKSFNNQAYQYKNRNNIDYTLSLINEIMKIEDKKKTLIIIPAKKDIQLNNPDKIYKELYWFQKLLSLSKINKFDIIDLNDVFDVNNVNRYFHSCDGHWSPYGNLVAAQYFLKFRKNRNN